MLTPVWQQQIMGISGSLLGMIIPAAGLALFGRLVFSRLAPLRSAQAAPWRDRPRHRLRNLVRYGLLQTKQNRYPLHALAHGLIFYGFIVSIPRLLVMVCPGLPGPAGALWTAYGALGDLAATAVIAGCCLALACRLGPYRARYPAGRARSAYGILAFVACLTGAEICCQAAFLAAGQGLALPFTPAGVISGLLPAASLDAVAMSAWLVHEVLFFAFLCILPVSKQFHEILGLVSLWCMRLDKGTVKACRNGISEEEADSLPYLGIAAMSDCTWQQLLHFYACADCGRCSDNCPATLAGRALSPREFMFRGRRAVEQKLSAPPWTGDELWDCALCGACEEECPLGIGHIDLMVDLRRNAVDVGRIPQGFSRALESLQRVASPLPRRNSAPPCPACDGDGEAGPDARGATLYLPAAYTANDPQAAGIAQAVYDLLRMAGHNPALLSGPARDAGHEARRWGDEYLFRDLRDRLLESIAAAAPARVVSEDPHTVNALRNDYKLDIPVLHASEVLAQDLAANRLRPAATGDARRFAFHDPCYLGRHAGMYEAPRRAIDALGLTRVELPRHADRALCCGGPAAFFHEPPEQRRPARMRLEEAASAGIAVLVTACPWCYVNFTENARSMGLNLEVADLARLVQRLTAGQEKPYPGDVTLYLEERS